MEANAETAPRNPVPDDLHAQHLLLLACSGRLSQIVEVLVELEVADHLAPGPLPVEELAERAGAHPDALYRVLRCAASVGIFAEGPAHVFSSTPLADGLRSDNPDGVLPLVRYNRMELTERPYASFLHSVRTGEPVFRQAFGSTFIEYLEQNPGIDDFYDGFMSHWSRQFAAEELNQWDLGRFRRIADLGGGDGFFLAQILKRHPDTTGVLVDLPHVAKKAASVLAEEGVADRAEIRAGDLLKDPLPEGCDGYLLKAVLHDFDDAEARRILTGVRESMPDSSARLLVVDSILDPGNAWDHGKFLDLDMLVLHGGRERNLDDWRELFAAAGFELLSEPIYHWTLLECRPV
uniref:Methyltransferase n=1 Tax=Streptomyces sp. SoC090715LN-16 TaxID=1898658 RepID=A0A3B8G5P2_9ACTN|nr:methyltransferase [Streptomyces sp. SoC090715LN-16]